MKFRTIPRTDLEVSLICLGSMNWGQQNTETEAHEQLDYAITQGVNFIDTAEVYPIPPDRSKQGRTESYIGTWLKRRGKRDDLIIASKVSTSDQIQTRPLSPGQSSRLDRENIMAAIDGSLERLQTDYLDIYQTHSPDRTANYWGPRGFENVKEENAVPIEETLEVLAEVIQSGKVRYIGVSNETAWGLMEHVHLAKTKNLPMVVTIQNQYSLLNRTFEIGLSEVCLRENIGLLPYSPLSMGVLTGKYLDGARPEGARFTLFQRNQARYNAPHLQAAVKKYVALAGEVGIEPAQLALAFVNSRAFVTSNIIGATSVQQLKIDIASTDIELSPDVMQKIAEIYREHPDPHA